MHVSTTHPWPQRDVGSKAPFICSISYLQVVWCRWGTGRGFHSQGPGQTWQVGWYKLHKVQKGQAEIQARWKMDGEQTLSKRTWGCWLTRSWAWPDNGACSPESQPCPRLHEKQWGWDSMTSLVLFKPNHSMIPWICELYTLAVKSWRFNTRCSLSKLSGYHRDVALGLWVHQQLCNLFPCSWGFGCWNSGQALKWWSCVTFHKQSLCSWSEPFSERLSLSRYYKEQLGHT